MNASDKSYLIFGRTVLVSTENEKLSQLLGTELGGYPRSTAAPDVRVVLKETLPSIRGGANNPKIHTTLTNGFRMIGKMVTADWSFHSKTPQTVTLALNEFSAVLRPLYRLLHRQKTTRTEMIGQILHESVLVPLQLLQEDRALLHASTIQAPKASSPIIALGGTGGSGKTSLMLRACTQLGWRFYADDITVLSNEGTVFPNLSYPKIYAYNLDAFSNLQAVLFDNTSFADRLHWKLHRLRGADKVRRRVDPSILFENTAHDASLPLAHYVILFREAIETMRLDPLTRKKAASLSVSILETEYNEFTNHLRWHDFNRRLSSNEATELEMTAKDWMPRIEQSLKSTQCHVLRIPSSLNHKDFLDEAWGIIEALAKDV